MKIKKNMQEHIDNLNAELKSYADSNNNVVFNQVKNTDNDYAQGSLVFDKFTVLFRCHYGGSGYRFMEPPFSETSTSLGCTIATYESLFLFDFCKIAFSAYDIHNVVNDTNFSTLCFHYIQNQEDSKIAISQILSFINKNMYLIKSIADNKNLQKQLIDNYIHDHKIFVDKNFNIDTIDGIEDEICDEHEIAMFLVDNINEGIYSFLLSGNYKSLVKQFDKAEKKNKLTCFEKRYNKYLYDYDFSLCETKSIETLHKKERNKIISSIINGIIAIISFIFSFICDFCFTDIYANLLPTEHTVLLYSQSTISFFAYVIGMALILSGIIYALPIKTIKEKATPVFNPKYTFPAIMVGIILILTSTVCTFISYNNNSITIKDGTMYIDNREISNEDNIQFLLIDGYIDSEDGAYYSYDYKDLYLITDNDYNGYRYCSVLTNDGYVTEEIIKNIESADCEILSYKTLDDYLTAHNID